PGINSRLAKLQRNYLVYLRGISPERVVTVDGGIASCLSQELWIVPIGSVPTPRNDAYSNEIVDTESAQKFDEYYYSSPEDGEDNEVGFSEAGNSLEAFAAALRNQPRSQAYIIVYPQYYIERWEDSVNGRRIITNHRRS